MNKLVSRVDIAYLPKRTKDPYQFLDDVDLNELNHGYQFCKEHGARSFCTYPDLINSIESTHYTTKLCAVIDFPDGDSQPEEKVFEAGRAFEICKKASSAELDVVLSMSAMGAIKDFSHFVDAHIDQFIKIKYIVELGNRNKDNLHRLLEILNIYEDNISYIKTNTGKRDAIEFDEKIRLVEDLRKRTSLPIKVSGGVNSWKQIQDYMIVAGENTIFGVSYNKIKEWD